MNPHLPPLTPNEPDNWRLRAACIGHDPEKWFPHPTQSAEPARTICRTCPVRTECLDDALTVPGTTGVWAGLMPSERGRIAKGDALRTCVMCGDLFPGVPNARYCGPSCRQENRRIQDHARHQAKRRGDAA